MTKNLIIYFSRAGQNFVNGGMQNPEKGNTLICAEYIRDSVGGDLFEIRTINGYSADYKECVGQAVAELKAQTKPELVEYIDNIDAYQNIFVCGPCWCGTYPMGIFSLLERLDFSGKKVTGLITHEGSGFANSLADLKEYCKNAEFVEGIAVKGCEAVDSRNAVESWAKSVI